MTKHNNISIFVPHIGCPHKCAFCDQHTISGAQKAPTADEVKTVCEGALKQVKQPENTEIAFFGGSFTAIPRGYMLQLLQAASEFVGSGKFCGIRVSTRPDYIDDEVLQTLKNYGVTAVELGAQSMNDEVLFANERGHTAEDVVKASQLIKQSGFELGLQMMTGLYKSTLQSDMEAAQKIVQLAPDTVRIYPTVVLKGTYLAQLFGQGDYLLSPFEDMVKLCAELLMLFEKNGIRVIKCGLHSSEFVERDMVAGYYHQAFRELCESEIYKQKMSEIFAENNISCGEVVLSVRQENLSKAIGHKKSNTEYFAKKGIHIKFVCDVEQTEEVKLKERR